MGDILDKIRESRSKKKERQIEEYSKKFLFEGKNMNYFDKKELDNIIGDVEFFAFDKNIQFINKKLDKIKEKKKDDYNIFNIENNDEFSYFGDSNFYQPLTYNNTNIINFNTNSNKLKAKIENSLEIIKQYFQKKTKSLIDYKTIFPDNKKAKEIVKKYTREKYISEKHEMLKGTGKFGKICSFVLILFIYIISFIYYNYQKNWYKEEYYFINEFDGNKLSIIREKNFDNLKNEQKFINDFSLSFYKFADLAYDEYKKVLQFKKNMNWDIINYGNLTKDNYFYTLKDDKTKNIIITFPGTKGMLQLLEEVLGSFFIKVDKTENILISRYFGERAQNLLNLIFNEEIINLLNKGYQITSTGHSLGGAMAQAFMYFAISQNFVKKENIPATITFNQPKVGNTLFAQFLTKNSFNIRFTHGKDIVSSIPFFDFKFFGLINYLLNKNELSNLYVHAGLPINIITSKYNFYDCPFIFIFLGICSFIYFIIYYFHQSIEIFKFMEFNFFRLYDKVELVLGLSYYVYIIGLYFISCFIGQLIYIYETYKFILIIIIIYIIIFFIYHILVFYSICFIFEFGVFCINRYYNLINLFKTEKKIIEFKKEEFKKAEPEEQYKIIGSFLFMSIGAPILGSVYDQTIVSHSTSNQRKGNEQFVLQEETISTLFDDIDDCKMEKEIGFKLLDKFDLSNNQLFKTT